MAVVVWLVAAVAAARDVQLAVGATTSVGIPGVTAAFAVDAAIVEATAIGGEVVLVGRRVGQTAVTVVTPAGVETLFVRVDSVAARAVAAAPEAAATSGSVEARYDSGTRRYTTGLTVATDDGERSALLRLYGVRESRDGAEGDALLSLPAASLELTAPGRSLVLLDELVEASPLTLDGTVLRGLHLRQGPLTLHAGVASATPWDDLLLPASGDSALGLSYRRELGVLRLVPAILWLPDAATDVPGVVSVALERGADGDALRFAAELGWSDEPGAALDLSFRGARQHGWLQGAHRPAGFAALGVARPAGTYLDGAWSRRLGDRTTADLALSASRLDIAGRRQEADSSRLELRHQASERWSLTAGLGGGGYRDRDREGAALRRETLSLGAAFDGRRTGVAGVYRYQETSGDGGHGGRLTARAGVGPWRAHFFVDAQEHAPTLGLVLAGRPDLARAFAELGFDATTPEEVIRLVRDHAALFAEHGVAVGDLDVDPLRLQSGLDVAWRGDGARRPELGLRLVVDDARGGAADRRAYLATLSAALRLFGDLDLRLGYTRWSTAREGLPRDDRGTFEIGLRTSLSGLRLPGGGRRPISGQVHLDAGATGDPADGLPPVAGVEIVLDGHRRTRTDGEGRFAFPAPGPGEHRVEALLPTAPGAFFTAPSTLTLRPGGEARFGVTFAAARLAGTVASDAGLPLAGVTVRLDGAAPAIAVTDSSGVYRFAAADGEATVAIVADSVPPGYDLAGLAPRPVRLARGAPAVADFTLPAQRTLAGIVTPAGAGPVTVTALEADRTVTPDAEGRFLFRGLPAGRVTLVYRGPTGEMRQVVELPAPPSAVGGIVLGGA